MRRVEKRLDEIGVDFRVGRGLGCFEKLHRDGRVAGLRD
jgi:hypothetical protein